LQGINENKQAIITKTPIKNIAKNSKVMKNKSIRNPESAGDYNKATTSGNRNDHFLSRSVVNRDFEVLARSVSFLVVLLVAGEAVNLNRRPVI
jgi:hypothetical protein